MNRFFAFCMILLFVQPVFSFGDLMSSKAHRERLNVQRSLGLEFSAPERKRSTGFKVDGFYFNSKDGKEQGGVWFNGKAEYNVKKNHVLPNGMVVKRLNEDEASLSIMKDNQRYSVRAGQGIVTEQVEIKDAFQ